MYIFEQTFINFQKCMNSLLCWFLNIKIKFLQLDIYELFVDIF